MTFSPEWEQRYRHGHGSHWPWSHLITYTKRYAKHLKPGSKALELGCGVGPNIPFLLDAGFEYYGLEGSPEAIAQAKQQFPSCHEHLVAQDFTKSLYFQESFDLIIDRSSITHNTTQAIQHTLQLIDQQLSTNGIFIGMDWFSTQHDSFREGEFTMDSWTKHQFPRGAFAGVGQVHFSDEEHLRELLSCFEIIKLEHKVIQTHIPQSDPTIAVWDFVAKKKL